MALLALGGRPQPLKKQIGNCQKGPNKTNNRLHSSSLFWGTLPLLSFVLILTDLDELLTDLDGRETAVVGWVMYNRKTKHSAAVGANWPTVYNWQSLFILFPSKVY